MAGNASHILWFDSETFSECDLKTAGTHAYAEHPSTEIMVVQWAVGDSEPQVADVTGRQPCPAELLALLTDPGVEVWAHNSVFDRTVLRHVWGLDVPIERWRDTMVQALSHGLPGALAKVGAALGLPVDEVKDARGDRLVRMFCKPLPANMKLRRATAASHPDEWAEFLEYSRQDIVSMRAISRAMPVWNYPGRPGERCPELELWHFDQRMNDRGFATDRELAEAAIRAVEEETARLKAEITDATGGAVTAPSQRDKLLEHILAEYGVTLPDMGADTLRRRIEDPELPEGVRLLLSIRLEASKSSTAKYRAALRAVSRDGRLRNTQQFCGAARTGRWAGRIFQPQNMPRPTMKVAAIASGIEALKAGVAPWFSDNVMALAANAVRGVIVAPAGRKLCIADLSNIEGRVLAWLAGEEWKLQAFRAFDAKEGPDLYIAAYARAFGVSHDAVGTAERQIGKVQELALGYQGGVGAFLTFAAVYGMDLDALAVAVRAAAPVEAWEEAAGLLAWTKRKKRSTFGLSDDTFIACQVLVSRWRAGHQKVVAFWGEVEDAARGAIGNPGLQTSAGGHIKMLRTGSWLRVRLPSGRQLCYLHPRADEKGISYVGVSPYTHRWGRISTYGGKLVENFTQAVARDVLACGKRTAEARGYSDVVLTVHDELLVETPDTSDFTWQGLSECLAAPIDWAAELPLAAAGGETRRYAKM